MRSGMDVVELRETYERFAPVVYRRALRIVRREADAWDVVQEVFHRLLRSPGDFRRESRPMTYIYRVTTNVALNCVRARGVRERERDLPVAEAIAPSSVDGVEARELVRLLVDRLDDRGLEIACLHFCDELTQDEIAEIVGLSRKTIGKELARIRELARALGSAEESGS